MNPLLLCDVTELHVKEAMQENEFKRTVNQLKVSKHARKGLVKSSIMARVGLLRNKEIRSGYAKGLTVFKG